jgi:hypothetical protein
MTTKTYEELEQRIKELEKESLERQQAEEKLKISFQTTKNIIQKDWTLTKDKSRIGW